MKHFELIAVTCLFVLSLMSSRVFASEVCSLLGGTCRDTCGRNEAPEAGAFEDCTDKQQCCVAHEAESGRLQCCIFSFDTKNLGPTNCGLPENNACLKGSGSPVPCSKLIFCK
jgi:hypothetical protein